MGDLSELIKRGLQIFGDFCSAASARRANSKDQNELSHIAWRLVCVHAPTG